MVFDACKSSQSLLHTDSSFWFTVWLCLRFCVFFFGCAMHSFFVCAEFWAALSFGEVFSDNFLIQMCFVSARLPNKKQTRAEMQTPSRIQYSNKTRIMLCLHTASMCFSFRIFSRFLRNVKKKC